MTGRGNYRRPIVSRGCTASQLKVFRNLRDLVFLGRMLLEDEFIKLTNFECKHLIKLYFFFFSFYVKQHSLRYKVRSICKESSFNSLVHIQDCQRRHGDTYLNFVGSFTHSESKWTFHNRRSLFLLLPSRHTIVEQAQVYKGYGVCQS